MTAVEYYNLKVIDLMKQREQGKIDVINFRNELDQVFERVKEIEKSEKEDAFNESRLTHPILGFKHLTFEDYYNETFKSE